MVADNFPFRYVRLTEQAKIHKSGRDHVPLNEPFQQDKMNVIKTTKQDYRF